VSEIHCAILDKMEIDAISIRSFDSSTKKAGMAAGSTTKLQCCDSATDQSCVICDVFFSNWSVAESQQYCGYATMQVCLNRPLDTCVLSRNYSNDDLRRFKLIYNF